MVTIILSIGRREPSIHSWLEQVPEVAVEVLEDGDGAVGVSFRFADEGDAGGLVAGVVAPEVVGVEEEEDAAAGLGADAGFLLRGGGAGEEEAGFGGAGRGDDDPAFGLLGDRGVFDEGEAEFADEEGEGFVVVADDEGDEAEGLFHGG